MNDLERLLEAMLSSSDHVTIRPSSPLRMSSTKASVSMFWEFSSALLDGDGAHDEKMRIKIDKRKIERFMRMFISFYAINDKIQGVPLTLPDNPIQIRRSA